MKTCATLAAALAFAACAQAAWYWPFGSGDDGDGRAEPRLSELMEPATTNIDAAVDFADEGKTNEAVEAYRRALAELDRIERENPKRAKLPEFATLRNKRAYVSAAIDSLLLGQIRANAKPVAVSDTTELEKKYAEEKKKAAEEKKKPSEKKTEKKSEPEKKPEIEKKPEAEKKPAAEKKPDAKPATVRERVMADIEAGDWAAAELGIGEMLAARPNDATALNLKAALEAERGDLKAAEAALDRAINSNPRSHYAYYNMADLMLRREPPNRDAARRYYETGRSMGGPEDPALEEATAK